MNHSLLIYVQLHTCNCSLCHQILHRLVMIVCLNYTKFWRKLNSGLFPQISSYQSTLHGVMRCSYCLQLSYLVHLRANRQLEDSDQTHTKMEELEGSGLINQSTTATIPTMSAPILSPSAIANIICSVLAIVFLTIVLCYLMRSFNQGERKTRIKTSLENNRRIDEQIAVAKARAEHRPVQTSLIQGSEEICTETNIQYKPLPRDVDPQPCSAEALDNLPSGSQMSSRVNREVLRAPALSSSRTSTQDVN